MHPDWQTQVLRYCEENSSPEPKHLQALTRYTWLNTTNPRQLSGHLQGRFLSMLSCLLRPSCILEIGTFTGYSALCMAEGLAKDGMVHTIEAESETAFKAREFIGNTPFYNKITVYNDRAETLIPKLEIHPDLVFIDGAKTAYRAYFDLVLPKMKPGGIIVFDNTLWSYKVLDKQQIETDEDTASIHSFNRYISSLEEITVLLMPLRDGLTILRMN